MNEMGSPLPPIPEIAKSHLSSHPISQPCQQARPCPKHKYGTYREEIMDEKSENIHVDTDSRDDHLVVNHCGSGQWLEDRTDSGGKDMEFNNGLFQHFEDDFGSCQA